MEQAGATMNAYIVWYTNHRLQLDYEPELVLAEDDDLAKRKYARQHHILSREFYLVQSKLVDLNMDGWKIIITKPTPKDSWICSCNYMNSGSVCTKCGKLRL